MKYAMAVTLDDIVYELYVMAAFCIEGSELSVPHRENFNFNCVLSRFTSFFKGFIGAGGWGMKAHKPLGESRYHGKMNKRIHFNKWMISGLCPI